MDLGLRGRKALVTGASRGIGRACAVRFAEPDFKLKQTLATSTLETHARGLDESSGLWRPMESGSSKVEHTFWSTADDQDSPDDLVEPSDDRAMLAVANGWLLPPSG